MFYRFICGSKLNKITPTTNNYDTTNIDSIYVTPRSNHQEFFKIKGQPRTQRITKYNQREKRITKNNKVQPRRKQNYKNKKWTFLLKFINCLKG